MEETILLIEDNEMNRDMLSRRLERLGYTVLTAEDGQQGISAALVHLPHIILLDMSLPIISGWEACTKLKSMEQTKHIPIIALTAHAMEEDKQRAFDVGCDEFETKPLDMAQLAQKIRHLLADNI